MRFKNYFFTLLLSLSFFTTTFADNPYIDSLILLADNSYSTSSDSCALFANKALELAKEEKYKTGEMHALYQLSKLAYDQGDLAKTLEYANTSLTIANESNSYKGKTDILNVIAKVYYRSKEFDKALTYARKSYKLADTANDSTLLPMFSELISTLKRSVGENDSAFIYIRKAIKINKHNNNLSSLSFSYNNLGILHYNNNNIDSALACFQQTLIIRKEIKAYKYLIQSHNNIGYILMQKGENRKAISNFIEAIQLGRKHDVITYLDLSYDNLTEAYEKTKRYGKALATHKKYTAIKDSISGEKAKAALLKVEQKIRLENEQAKAKTLLIQIENEKNYQHKQNLLIIILLIVLILTIIILRTSKKRALETQLQIQKTEAAKSIIHEQEKIREEIAQELHDGIGGSLAGLKLSLSNLQSENNCGRLLKEIDHLETTYQEVRNISHNLNPISFQKNTFSETIENYLHRTFPNLEIGVCFQCYPKEELEALKYEQKICVYRIIQELSSNIQKHALATNTNIHLTGHKTYLTIMAEDNGKGFNPKITKNGIGFRNIKKRITLYDGKIEIDSEKGNGTTVIIDIPYTKA